MGVYKLITSKFICIAMNFDKSFSLKDKTIVITRSQDQQVEARRSFEMMGANVLELPALVIGPPDDWRPLDDALSELETFHWIIFSSSNGVKAVESRLSLTGRSLSSRPSGLKIAAVGQKTAKSLEIYGVEADFVPPKFVADSLIKNFPVSGLGLRMLFPRVQSGGRPILTEAFRDAGVKVVQVSAYESRCPEEIPGETVDALDNGKVDVIAFTSSKTVVHTAQLMSKYFESKWQKKLLGIKLVSIGPQTSISCKKYFDRIDQEADPHDLEGLVCACIAATKN
ncbi:uroporphyrinogen-III synthase [Prochlorococcus marinus]|uniref:Uroporphyrinogen-III synthase n=1 Tax=Prochlorococcus marinus (strain MIT 9211) TaxID=93059 RepID=A9BCX2_PROM4|nr:putative uroporphyrinogen III synthase [Prochlorococcus marinus str. MIT 9211]